MASYHERQQLWQCAVHSLNNLFQERWTSRELLDNIAEELHRSDQQQQQAGFFNPYKSVVPYMGYYDIGVLAAALKLKNACMTEHFAVASAMSVDRLQEATASCIGIIVNIETITALVFKGKHWYTILRTGDSFLNHDSKLESAVSIPDIQQLHDFLVQEITNHRAQIFVVSHIEASSTAQNDEKS